MPLPHAQQGLGDWVRDLPRPGVACAIVQVVGSAPQEVGARMWVGPSDFLGTLGGGEFERRVLEDARTLLSTPDARTLLREYVLCREMGQCCGGRVQVFFEPVRQKRRVHLFGAGHVGRALAQVLSGMPFETLVVDPRPEWADRTAFPPDVRVLCSDPLAYARETAFEPRDAAAVFTHSHDLDLQLVRGLLPKPLGYLGLIGSEHKADVFRARLLSSGEDGERLASLWDERVRCPIGLPLDSKNPKVIAVGVAAELLRDWGLKPTPRPGDIPAERPAEASGMAPSARPKVRT